MLTSKLNRNIDKLKRVVKSDELQFIALWIFFAVIIAFLTPFLIDFQATFGFAGVPTTSIFVLTIVLAIIFLLARVFKLRVGGVICSLILGFSCSFSIISITLPAIAHYVTSRESEIRLTVKKKHSNYDKWVCRPRVFFEEITAPIMGHICVEKRVFDKLFVGQVICVFGNVSSFGISRVNDFDNFRECKKEKK